MLFLSRALAFLFDNPLGKMLGDKFEAFKGEDGVLDPAAVAETYWHLAHQPRSAWTHEVDLRPWTDVPWWNDN